MSTTPDRSLLVATSCTTVLSAVMAAVSWARTVTDPPTVTATRSPVLSSTAEAALDTLFEARTRPPAAPEAP